MKLDKVQIENIGGIEYLEFPMAGSLVEITGDNGVGKTSVLTALRAVFESGHDFAVVRLGEKKGRVTLTMDDKTVVQLTITEKQSRVEITAPGGQTVPAPRSFLNELAAGFAFDPTAIIRATPKERTAYLLSAMPITFTPEEITAATGDKVSGAAMPLYPVDLDYLASYREGVFNQRKALNKTVRDSEGTIASLRQGMPAEDGTDWGAKWKALEEEATDVEVQIRDKEREVAEEYTAAVAEYRAQIAKLEKRIDEARDARDLNLKKVADVAKPERNRLATEKAQAWEHSQAQGKAAGARQTIQTMQDTVRKDSVESERLTRVLEALDALRRRKLDELPIPGVELKDGEVFVGGVPFEQLNTAQQFALSIRLATLKLGRLPLLVIDHGECFSPETWESFRESARDSKLQIVVARVTSGSLGVTAT